jgi:hypothetical protein
MATSKPHVLTMLPRTWRWVVEQTSRASTYHLTDGQRKVTAFNVDVIDPRFFKRMLDRATDGQIITTGNDMYPIGISSVSDKGGALEVSVTFTGVTRTSPAADTLAVQTISRADGQGLNVLETNPVSHSPKIIATDAAKAEYMAAWVRDQGLAVEPSKVPTEPKANVHADNQAEYMRAWADELADKP